MSASPDEFGNDPSIEAVWAIKAYEHAQVYFNILCSVNPSILKLTPNDDMIYDEFKKDFPDFSLSVVNEDELKSEEAKLKWRPFCNRFDGVVEDFNFGTLLRINSDQDYSESNSILVTRIQFYAIEISRNRCGLNNKIKDTFRPESDK